MSDPARAHGHTPKSKSGDDWPTQVAIIDSITTEDSNPYTLYVIEVHKDGRSWTLKKRYSEFRDIHEKLLRRLSAKQVPEIPPKKALGTLDPEFVRKRREALNIYLQELMRRPAIAETDDFCIFLQLEKEGGVPGALSAVAAAKGALKVGYVMKQGHYFRQWKRRYLVLRDNVIYYYKADSDLEPKGSIFLDGCSIKPDDKRAGKDHAFGIYHPKARTFFIECVSEDEMLAWIRAIENEEQRVGISDFELLAVVGKGSFGKVIQVKKKDTGQILAMKVLRKEAVRQRNQIEHTKTERALLQRIRHPFLVDLKYAFQTEDKLYMVLDYVNGGELFSHLKRERRFGEERARLYASQVLLALEYLHSMDVIYRDLKPENILLDADGNVRLTDFGLSKMVTGEKATYTFCGTPEYMAPEILMDEGHGKAVDWWSLGILIYEMLVGLPPFYSRNKKEMYFKILKCELRFPTYVTASARELLQGLLTRAVASRLGSGADDAASIKSSAWFATVDWDKVFHKEYEPTFKPTISGGTTDFSNFDPAFTREKPEISPTDPSKLSAAEQQSTEFEGFTYTAQSILAGGTGAEPHDFTVSDNPRRPAAAPGDDFSFDR